jgi:beta-ureidopropionase
MSGNKNVSRRIFLKKSGASAGLIGLGAYSSSLYPGNSLFNNPATGFEKNSPREVRVLTISQSGLENSKDILTGMITRIKTMSLYRPDIICLPEVFSRTTAKEPEEVPGPATKSMSVIAKELGCYIICPVHTKAGGNVYNSAVLIDRQGNMAGQYNKIHPVTSEIEKGVTPGSTPPPVFKTDFGTIGILICFDINWTEEWKSLKDQGAEIVFWPSAFPGGRMLPALAWMFKYYIVGCAWRDPATIYDITGDMIQSSGRYEHWAFAKLNLEKVFLEIVNYENKLNNIKKKYGKDILIKYCHDEDWVTVESCSPDLHVNDILKEYNLVPHWDYIKTEEKEQKKYRNSKG